MAIRFGLLGALGALLLTARPSPEPLPSLGAGWLPRAYEWDGHTVFLPGGRRIEWHEAADLLGIDGVVFEADGVAQWRIDGLSEGQVVTAWELLCRARDQQDRDERDAAEAIRSGGRTLGERLFLIHCAACHGPTGRVVGPGVAPLETPPRSFADPAVLDPLADEYLRELFFRGGAAMGISGVMPAFPGLLDEDYDAIIRHLRTLPER